MLVTITQFRELARDANGNALPLGAGRQGCEALTEDDTFTALDEGAKFVRVATDTAIQMDIAGGATDGQSEFFPANSVEYIAVRGGEELTIVTVA